MTLLETIEHMPGPAVLVLKPSWRKWALVLTVCLVFMVIGGFAMRYPESATDTVMGLLSVVLFGGGGLFVLAQLLLGKSELKLDQSGFTVVTLRRAEFFPWVDVADFGVARVSRRNFVTFSLNRPSTRWGRLNAALTGHSHALPDTYGMPAAELAMLMTLCWQRAVGP